jgi:hypothetical protein
MNIAQYRIRITSGTHLTGGQPPLGVVKAHGRGQQSSMGQSDWRPFFFEVSQHVDGIFILFLKHRL